MGKTPDWLLKKVKASVGTQPAKELKLSSKQIARARILEGRLTTIAHDIWVQHFTSTILGLNAKYLTNRDIDISFLNAISEDDDFTRYNHILRTHLLYELPVLQNVPLTSLLDIRAKEHDSFLLYRNAINEVVKQYISGRRSLSGREAKEIYEDVVYPKLCELNAKVNSIRRSLVKKSVRDVSITSSIVTVGLFSGLLPLELLIGLGGIKITKDVLDSIVQSIQTPQEVRNDNFYFLWKLSKKVGIHSLGYPDVA